MLNKPLYMRFFGISRRRLDRTLAAILNPEVKYFTQIDRYEVVVELLDSSAELSQLKASILKRLSKYYIGNGKSTSIEQLVGGQLIERKLSITGAESLTAGMFQSTLGDVPGISAVFPGGLVTYSNHAKHQLLGIPSRVINHYGVVSKQVAKWMANQSRKIMGTDLSVSFTGVAGPSSLENHPAGTVWIGYSAKGQQPKALLYHLDPLYRSLSGFKTTHELVRNSRNGIRLLSVKSGLKIVNDELNRNR